ncbi:MAG: hypothetical protein JXQ83_07560 [Candidatus Glassbacteria bacterium]|nr:hypothetical protein [Candidatus Glassbacteria bacterium]
MTERKAGKKVWWGSFSLPEDRSGRWRIGSASFWVERLANEWRVAYRAGDESADNGVEVSVPLPGLGDYGTEAQVARFGVGATGSTVTLAPALADRSVVIRPDTPLYILPNREVTFYVSSPLWLRIETGKPPTVLQDVPIFRPSDTWFGPSTMEGELCYANRVYGRLKLEDIRFRPYRAVTVVYLRNRGDDSILLERLNLPVPNLSLYEAGDSTLWTQAVALEMGADSKAGLELAGTAPREAANAKLICGPRQQVEKSILSRAVKSFIG